MQNIVFLMTAWDVLLAAFLMYYKSPGNSLPVNIYQVNQAATKSVNLTLLDFAAVPLFNRHAVGWQANLGGVLRKVNVFKNSNLVNFSRTHLSGKQL